MPGESFQFNFEMDWSSAERTTQQYIQGLKSQLASLASEQTKLTAGGTPAAGTPQASRLAEVTAQRVKTEEEINVASREYLLALRKLFSVSGKETLGGIGNPSDVVRGVQTYGSKAFTALGGLIKSFAPDELLGRLEQAGRAAGSSAKPLPPPDLVKVTPPTQPVRPTTTRKMTPEEFAAAFPGQPYPYDLGVEKKPTVVPRNGKPDGGEVPRPQNLVAADEKAAADRQAAAATNAGTAATKNQTVSIEEEAASAVELRKQKVALAAETARQLAGDSEYIASTAQLTLARRQQAAKEKLAQQEQFIAPTNPNAAHAVKNFNESVPASVLTDEAHAAIQADILKAQAASREFSELGAGLGEYASTLAAGAVAQETQTKTVQGATDQLRSVDDEYLAATANAAVALRERKAAEEKAVQATLAGARGTDLVQLERLNAEKRATFEAKALAGSEEDLQAMAGRIVAEKELQKALNDRVAIELKARAQASGQTGTLTQRALAAASPGNSQKPVTDYQTLGQLLGGGALTTAKFAFSGVAFFGIYQGLQDTFKEAVLLQKEFALLQAQLDETGRSGDFSTLRDGILEVSRNTGVAASELANMAIQLRGAFADQGPKFVNQQLDAAAKLARVSGLSIKDVTNSLTALRQTYDITFPQIGDEALALQNRFGVLAKETIEATAQFAPAAKEAGLSFAELATLSAHIQQVSGKTGTSIADSLARILPSVQDNAEKIVAVLNQVPATAGRVDEVINLIGQGKTGQVLKFLIDNFSQLNKQQQQTIVAALGGRREAQTLNALFTNVGTFRGQFDNANRDASRSAGTLDDQFKKLETTLGQTFAEMKRAAQQLGLVLLSSGIASALGDIAKIASVLLKILNPLVSTFNQLNFNIGLGSGHGFLSTLLEGLVLAKGGKFAAGALGAGGVRGLGSSLLNVATFGALGTRVGGGAAAAEGALGGATGPAAFLTGAVGKFGTGVDSLAAFFGSPASLGLPQLALAIGTFAASFQGTQAVLHAIFDGADSLTRQMESEANAAKAVAQSDKADIPKAFNDYIKTIHLDNIKTAANHPGLATNLDVKNRVSPASEGLIPVARPNQPVPNADARAFGLEIRKPNQLPEGLEVKNGPYTNLEDKLQAFRNVAKQSVEAARVIAEQTDHSSAEYKVMEQIIDAAATKAKAVQNKKFKTDVTNQKDYQGVDANVAGLKKAFDIGAISSADYIDTLHQGVLSYQKLADASVGQNRTKFLDALFSYQAGENKAQSDIVKNATDIQLQLNRFSGQQFGPSDLSLLIGELKNPNFKDASDRASALKDILTGYGEVLKTQVDALKDPAAKLALLQTGIPLDPATKLELIREQVDNALKLSKNGLSVLLKVAAITNQEVGDIEEKISEYIQTKGLTYREAYREVVQEELDDIIHHIQTLAKVKSKNKNIMKGVNKQIQALSQAAEALYPVLNDLAKPDGGDSGDVTINIPDSYKGSADAIANATNSAVDEAKQLALARLDFAKALAGSDPVAAAQIDIQKADTEAQFAKTELESVQAATARVNAEHALKNAVAGIYQAYGEYLKAVVAQDPLKVAQISVNEANAAIANAEGAAAQLQAQAQLVAAQKAVQQAIFDIVNSQTELFLAMASAGGQTVKAASLALQEAYAKLQQARAQGAGEATLNQLQGQVVQQQAALRDSQLSYSESTIDFNLQAKRISTAQAIAEYQALLNNASILGLTETQTRDLILKIQGLKQSLNQDLQFNLPSELRLPTLYEARRLNQSGGSYQDNRQISIQLNGNDPTAMENAVNTIVDAVNGPPVYGTRPRIY